MLLLCFITGFTAATANDAGSAQDGINEEYGTSFEAMNTGAGVLFCKEHFQITFVYNEDLATERTIAGTKS